MTPIAYRQCHQLGGLTRRGGLSAQDSDRASKNVEGASAVIRQSYSA
jgi:hypothetical protein